MRRNICIVLVCISMFCLACEDKKTTTPVTPKIPLGEVATDKSESVVNTHTASSSPTKLLRLDRDPLSVAHREYLSAYNTYVMLLRESGPQTMETLEALANYQKKYQLYRMLMGKRGHR